MSAMKIVTSNMFPPIPDRRFDWCAYYEGEEEARNYGWGRTEEEAIADLFVAQPDRAEGKMRPINSHVAEPFRSILNAHIPSVAYPYEFRVRDALQGVVNWINAGCPDEGHPYAIPFGELAELHQKLLPLINRTAEGKMREAEGEAM